MPPPNQTPPISTHSGATRHERRELNAALRQRQPHAIGTWLLLAVNTAIYTAMAIDAGRIAPFPSRLLIAWGALFAPEVANGEWWRLFTATFLHVHVAAHRGQHDRAVRWSVRWSNGWSAFAPS